MRISMERYRGSEPLVLVVEDEETQSGPLSEAIQREGIRCSVCRSAVDGYRQAVRLRPDMFVIDVNLEHEGAGFDLVGQIRQLTLAPILILTGRSTSQDDARLAVERSATAYLHKMNAQPSVVAGFIRQQLITMGKMAPARIRLGELTLDVDARRISLAERQADLSPMLVELCACLMEPPGGRKPAEALARRLYRDDDESAIISIRTHMNRLRSVLLELSPRLTISGRRNYGYCFILDGQMLQGDFTDGMEDAAGEEGQGGSVCER